MPTARRGHEGPGSCPRRAVGMAPEMAFAPGGSANVPHPSGLETACPFPQGAPPMDDLAQAIRDLDDAPAQRILRTLARQRLRSGDATELSPDPELARAL